jgi:hypothetical protein
VSDKSLDPSEKSGFDRNGGVATVHDNLSPYGVHCMGIGSSSPLKIRGVIWRQFQELSILRILLKNHQSIIPDVHNELSTSHFYHAR